MSIGAKVAKHVVLDKFESQIKTAEAKLEIMKVKAEAAKAIFEIKATAALLPKMHAIRQKVQEPKTSGGNHWEQAKADVEARIAKFEKSLDELESKAKVS